MYPGRDQGFDAWSSSLTPKGSVRRSLGTICLLDDNGETRMLRRLTGRWWTYMVAHGRRAVHARPPLSMNCLTRMQTTETSPSAAATGKHEGLRKPRNHLRSGSNC